MSCKRAKQERRDRQTELALHLHRRTPIGFSLVRFRRMTTTNEGDKSVAATVSLVTVLERHKRAPLSLRVAAGEMASTVVGRAGLSPESGLLRSLL